MLILYLKPLTVSIQILDNFYSYHHILYFYIRRIFSEKFGGDAVHEEVPCTAWTTKAPKFVQPDLNFIGK